MFKCRASAIGNIVTLPRSKKDREAGVLSKTAQTYVQDWLKGQSDFYNRRKTFSSKYTRKGNEVEDASLDFAAEMLGYHFLFKNEQHFSNDWITGIMDAIPEDCVIDVKNSWDQHTFPIFADEIPNKYYWWQGQGYMWLTGRTKYKLVYTLTDTPADLIYSEARRYCYNSGLDLDLYLDEVYEEFVERMTYSDIDPHLKIKVFEFGADPEAIKLIRDRVEACRKYVDELIEKTEMIIQV